MNSGVSGVAPDPDATVLKERVVELERKLLELLSAPQPDHVDTSASRWSGSPASALHEISSGDAHDRRPAGTTDLMGRHNSVWQLALADPHTGLANKLLLLDRLEHALIRSERHGEYVIVIYFDLINLNHICDEFGYEFGLEILIELSDRLTSSLRDEDTVGRAAGTELVAVIAIENEGCIGPIAERLELAFKRPFVVNGQPVRLSAHLGIVVARNSESSQEVLDRARGAIRVGEGPSRF